MVQEEPVRVNGFSEFGKQSIYKIFLKYYFKKFLRFPKYFTFQVNSDYSLFLEMIYFICFKFALLNDLE